MNLNIIVNLKVVFYLVQEGYLEVLKQDVTLMKRNLVGKLKT